MVSVDCAPETAISIAPSCAAPVVRVPSARKEVAPSAPATIPRVPKLCDPPVTCTDTSPAMPALVCAAVSSLPEEAVPVLMIVTAPAEVVPRLGSPLRTSETLPPVPSDPSRPGPLPPTLPSWAEKVPASRVSAPTISTVPPSLTKVMSPAVAEPFWTSPLPPCAQALSSMLPPTKRPASPLTLTEMSPATASCPTPVLPLLRRVKKSSRPRAVVSITRLPPTEIRFASCGIGITGSPGGKLSGPTAESETLTGFSASPLPDRVKSPAMSMVAKPDTPISIALPAAMSSA